MEQCLQKCLTRKGFREGDGDGGLMKEGRPRRRPEVLGATAVTRW